MLVEENKRFLYIFFIFINYLKKISELNKSEICTLTSCLSREVTKKLIVTQSWYDSIKRFFQFHTLLFLEMDANLTGLFLFKFETTLCKNHSDTNLVKIHSAVSEILSFPCSALFLVTAAILESQTAKNITDSYKKHSGTKLDQFRPMGLEILSFSCLCYLYYQSLVVILDSQFA